MKQNLFIALSAAFLLASCSNSEELQTSEGQEAINATAVWADATDSPVSRAPLNGLPTDATTLAVKFARLNQSGTGGTYPANYTTATENPATIDKDGKVVFTPTLYYLTNDEIGGTKLVGWLPATGSLTSGVVTFTIDGKTDVLLSNEKPGSRKSGEKFGTNDFTFDHKLTQVVVKAYAYDDPSAGETSLWGKITKIEVLAQPNECKITLPATVATPANSSNNIALKAPGVDTDMATLTLAKTAASAAATCGYAIIAPTTGKTLKLKVTTSTGIVQDVDMTLGTATKYEAGKRYTVLLKFSVAGIEPKVTAITPWTDATTAENPGEIIM